MKNFKNLEILSISLNASQSVNKISYLFVLNLFILHFYILSKSGPQHIVASLFCYILTLLGNSVYNLRWSATFL